MNNPSQLGGQKMSSFRVSFSETPITAYAWKPELLTEGHIDEDHLMQRVNRSARCIQEMGSQRVALCYFGTANLRPDRASLAEIVERRARTQRIVLVVVGVDAHFMPWAPNVGTMKEEVIALRRKLQMKWMEEAFEYLTTTYKVTNC